MSLKLICLKNVCEEAPLNFMNIRCDRFGDPKLQTPENKPFSQIFQQNYAGRILEGHLNFLNTIRVGGYLPDRVTNLLLQYLSNRFVCISFMYILVNMSPWLTSTSSFLWHYRFLFLMDEFLSS